MTNNNNRSADDVIVRSAKIKELTADGVAHMLKTINLSELAEKVKPFVIKGQSIRTLNYDPHDIDIYMEGYNDGIEAFLSKIREAMK